MPYSAAESRYENMTYKRCGKSGIRLPVLSLGLWHNFGGVDVFENSRAMLRHAFDAGITQFDLANNYGPPYGSAEETFGRVMQKDFRPYRDEMIITTKAGYDMWPGPYGDGGSKKYLTASLDASLKRMGLDYVDIFYSHRPDPETPVEETMAALHLAVQQGKALYAGISNYNAEQSQRAIEILDDLGTPCLIHQARYSMFDRWVEDGLLDVLRTNGVGCIAFSPLEQGLLTDRYLHGIPQDSRAAKEHGFLSKNDVERTLDTVKKLNEHAQKRGQSLAQMALAWLLRKEELTSVLIGASSADQLANNLKMLDNQQFDADELETIEAILKS